MQLLPISCCTLLYFANKYTHEILSNKIHLLHCDQLLLDPTELVLLSISHQPLHCLPLKKFDQTVARQAKEKKKMQKINFII